MAGAKFVLKKKKKSESVNMAVLIEIRTHIPPPPAHTLKVITRIIYLQFTNQCI